MCRPFALRSLLSQWCNSASAALPCLALRKPPVRLLPALVVTCLLATMRVALKGVAATLILAAPMLRVRADLVIGTVVDVNMMETEKQDFEEGWAQWRETNMELIDTTNNSDSRVMFYSLKKRYVMTSIC